MVSLIEGQTWWDAFAQAGGIPDLETWLGGVDAASRIRLRERIAECRYESVLDCGAGIGIDRLAYGNFSHHVSYTGLEPSAALIEVSVKALRRAGIENPDEHPIVQGVIQDMPFDDQQFDLVYARHIFEHLPRIDKPLEEMVRCAKLEVIVVFFMRPGAETYMTRERDGLWQNRWSKAEVEKLAASHPRAEAMFWETLDNEVLLHLYLNDATHVDFSKVGERIP